MSTNAAAPIDVERRLAESGATIEVASGSYAVDGVEPSLVATPQTVEQLAAVLVAANDAGAAVVPFGSGSGIALGSIPRRYDVALRTSGLQRVVEYEPADLTISVEAGMTLGALQALLRERGQFLPVDAPDEATLGGVFATGLGGPSTHAYGLPRDWLIGCRVVHADGTLTKAGGRVVKNVAGYDMTKLYAGSLGTLAVIAELTLKVAPLPPTQETLVAECSSIAATALVHAAGARGLALRAIAVVAGAGGRPRVAFRLAGVASAVERTRRELREIVPDGQDILDDDGSRRWWAEHDRSLAGTVVRLSALPSDVGAMLEQFHDAHVVAYPTTGLVRAALAGEDTALVERIVRLRRTAQARGGSLVIEAAPRSVKERVDVWGELPGLDLMRRLKQQFDPGGTLSPGRFAGGL